MTTRLFVRAFTSCGSAAALYLLTGCTGNAPIAQPASSAALAQPADSPAAVEPLHAFTYSGAPAALETLDRDIAAAAKDASKVDGIVARLISILGEPGVTADARQEICQRLGQLLTEQRSSQDAVRVLWAMLNDEAQVNAGRLALEPVPGARVDALFLRALASSADSTRVALIQTVGNRRIAAAVPTLAPLLGHGDRAVAVAAANALASVGTPEALAALRRAPEPLAPSVVEARLECARHLAVGDAAAELHAIYDERGVNAAQRAAAFRGLLDVEPDAAASRIAEVLAGDDLSLKQVAIEAIAAHPAADLVPVLARAVAGYEPATQAAVLAALGRRGGSAAVPAAIGALAHEDAGVRAAAIDALGRLPGNADTASRLARIAAEAVGEEAKLARASLARLSGPGVHEAVLTGAEGAELPVRLVYLEAIGSRYMIEALPALLAKRADAEPKVRSAALAALGEIAPGEQQAAILDWASHATDAQEISRALRTLISVSQRIDDKSTREQAIIQAIERGDAALQRKLIPVLPRLASAATAACAGRLALSSDEQVASDATAALARWDNDSVLPQLGDVAAKSPHDRVRHAAVRGAMSLLDRNRGLPAAEKTDMVAALLQAARDVDQRKQLVRVLGRGSSEAARKHAESLQSDPELGEEARDAITAIEANRSWPPRLKASTSDNQIKNVADGKPGTVWRVSATAEQWFQVEFERSRPIRRITLDQTGRAGDYPERYEVYVTDDAASPGEARATGQGARDKTVIDLPSGTRGKIVLLKHVAERKDSNWAVAELQVD